MEQLGMFENLARLAKFKDWEWMDQSHIYICNEIPLWREQLLMEVER